MCVRAVMLKGLAALSCLLLSACWIVEIHTDPPYRAFAYVPDERLDEFVTNIKALEYVKIERISDHIGITEDLYENKRNILIKLLYADNIIIYMSKSFSFSDFSVSVRYNFLSRRPSSMDICSALSDIQDIAGSLGGAFEYVEGSCEGVADEPLSHEEGRSRDGG